jgi:acyl-CoA synthetase (AMP-forming)/AMP-acid ligase II
MDEHRLRIDLAPHHHKLLDMTIPQVLDFAAQTWPERTAVKIIEERVAEYSWARLRTTVDHMRSGLHRAGVAPGDKVGLLLATEWRSR